MPFLARTLKKGVSALYTRSRESAHHTRVNEFVSDAAPSALGAIIKSQRRHSILHTSCSVHAGREKEREEDCAEQKNIIIPRAPTRILSKRMHQRHFHFTRVQTREGKHTRSALL